jgi:hypothetical protein
MGFFDMFKKGNNENKQIVDTKPVAQETPQQPTVQEPEPSPTMSVGYQEDHLNNKDLTEPEAPKTEEKKEWEEPVLQEVHENKVVYSKPSVMTTPEDMVGKGQCIHVDHPVTDYKGYNEADRKASVAVSPDLVGK